MRGIISKLIVTLILAVVCLGVGDVHADQLVSIESNLVVNRYGIRDAVFPPSSDVLQTYSGSTLPADVINDATLGGLVPRYSRTRVDYGGDPSGAILNHEISFSRGGTEGAYAFASGKLEFTVSENATFQLSGGLNVTDVSDSGGRIVSLSASLYEDGALSNPLFRSSQKSQSTLNEGFQLGGGGGDFSNFRRGTMTGQLEAGKTYFWVFNATVENGRYTSASVATDQGATAEGGVKLVIAEDTSNSTPSVPEPSTLMLFGFGMLGGLIRRRRQSAVGRG